MPNLSKWANAFIGGKIGTKIGGYSERVIKPESIKINNWERGRPMEEKDETPK